jgi:hypothetical protein
MITAESIKAYAKELGAAESVAGKTRFPRRAS